jgi:hypothetical protein
MATDTDKRIEQVGQNQRESSSNVLSDETKIESRQITSEIDKTLKDLEQVIEEFSQRVRRSSESVQLLLQLVVFLTIQFHQTISFDYTLWLHF